MKCIIMCAGDFSPMDIDREENDFVIAADNGLTYLQKIGVVPDLFIGDMDSLSGEGRLLLKELESARPGSIIRLPVEKDDTDTLAAVREGLKRGYDRFYLYGALGGKRIDHTIANIQTLRFIKEHGAQGYIMDTSCMMFILKNETRRFAKGFTGGFSLFSMDETIRGVTIRGMQYETENTTITGHFPIGVSNHIPGDRQAEVTVREGTALAVVSWQE